MAGAGRGAVACAGSGAGRGAGHGAGHGCWPWLLAVALAVALAAVGKACCGSQLGVGHGRGRSRSGPWPSRRHRRPRAGRCPAQRRTWARAPARTQCAGAVATPPREATPSSASRAGSPAWRATPPPAYTARRRGTPSRAAGAQGGGTPAETKLEHLRANVRHDFLVPSRIGTLRFSTVCLPSTIFFFYFHFLCPSWHVI